jgi:hypothetical protein
MHVHGAIVVRPGEKSKGRLAPRVVEIQRWQGQDVAAPAGGVYGVQSATGLEKVTPDPDEGPGAQIRALLKGDCHSRERRTAELTGQQLVRGFSVAAIVLTIAATASITLGCGDPSTTKDAAPSDLPTTSESAPAPVASVVTHPVASTTQVPAGTVALFDVRNRTAKKLDLGRSIISADWIDDGETFLALDVNMESYVALRTDGSLGARDRRCPAPSRDACC